MRERSAYGRASMELYPVVLEAFQGICRGFVQAAACRAIDRNQFNLTELARGYCPTARRACGLEFASHGLHGSGGTRPSVTETGTMRPSSVMRPIITGLERWWGWPPI